MHLSSSIRRRPWLALVACLVFIAAQLGTATHSLHLTATKADTTCGFCIGGTHWAPASAAPVVVHAHASCEAPVVVFTSVCFPQPLLSPRTSRGPPSSSLFA